MGGGGEVVVDGEGDRSSWSLRIIHVVVLHACCEINDYENNDKPVASRVGGCSPCEIRSKRFSDIIHRRRVGCRC